MSLCTSRGKGWYFEFSRECPLAVPDLDGDCSGFPMQLEQVLKGLQYEALMGAVNGSANLRSLQWSPPRRALEKAGYLFLAKHKVRAIARLRMGMNGLAVHRLAWKGVPWEDRLCKLCGEVETETHVFADCGVFNPERKLFFAELLASEVDCADWDTGAFMRFLVAPSRAESSMVARFVRSVWKEIDERVLAESLIESD